MNPVSMLLKQTLFVIIIPICIFSQQPIIVNHHCTIISVIPEHWITQAKTDLHIAYGHTSHGSQLVDGMEGMVGYMNGLGCQTNMYACNNGGTAGALDLRDTPFSNASDLGNPNRTAWESATRNYLNAHSEINVIIWSWCGQVSSASESDINTYLTLMSGLETEFPDVRFVYMTGHLDGGGKDGNLNIRNNQIRSYCQANNKILYDFADIESYDPDGNINYMELDANDNCDYDSSGHSRNWAVRWQNSHTENVDWYECSAAHSQSLNGNRKAYAAWWLWARIAGWDGITGIESNNPEVIHECKLFQNYPNPFNPTTTIRFALPVSSHASLKIFDVLGKEVFNLIDDEMSAGEHSIQWNASSFPSGIYFYRLQTPNYSETRKFILQK